ncbi:ATP-binding protein [Paracoccus sp. TK19116]|uniref:histidine kinase n=1 Tax=Paracoccus albicereus TaxID=2922394 RepID=A0ABT1MQ61_9RHOB|nr:ATP-binding protein [Paracoccus albicereus]
MPFFVGSVALCLGVCLIGIGPLTNYYLSDSKARGENTMRLVVATLKGELARYERLPQLLAQQELVKDVVSDDEDPERVDAANAYLASINTLLGSSDLYVMNRDGLTVAASNYNSAVPFNGQNFSYRPYFSDALAGGEGRFYGLGTTSQRRGYYFAAPVRDDGEITGVIAQKIDLDLLEESWRAAEYEITVTDPEGIIFLSARHDWAYASLSPLSAEALQRSQAIRRYAEVPIGVLPLSVTGRYDGADLVTVDAQGGARRFLVIAQEMPDAGWTVRVLVDTASARAQAWTMVLLAVLAIALLTLGIAVLMQRRSRQRELARYQRETQAQLKSRVERRTAELASVNARLRDEVSERRSTETELRRTQRRLVQSAKLAAIGQMSAALSHEFNQPLGAMRNFAENAESYIERGRSDEARQNITRILSLTDRMTEISRTLRNFARKPRQQLGPVDLSALIAESIEVISWRLKGKAVRIDADAVPSGLKVVAEPVRLQQVLVNLLANALDALSEADDATITLTGNKTDDRVMLKIEDDGPGIPADLRERIFDPFFSTKGVGHGLGLGLSISYNIIRDFDGELRLLDASGNGATFEIELRAATGREGDHR